MSELAFLTGDFSGEGLLDIVTLRLIFRPRCSRSLAATHSGQSGSLHCCTTIFFFFFGICAVLGFAALCVARCLLEVVEVSDLLLLLSAEAIGVALGVLVDFEMAATGSATAPSVGVVRVE